MVFGHFLLSWIYSVTWTGLLISFSEFCTLKMRATCLARWRSACLIMSMACDFNSLSDQQNFQVKYYLIKIQQYCKFGQIIDQTSTLLCEQIILSYDDYISFFSSGKSRKCSLHIQITCIPWF